MNIRFNGFNCYAKGEFYANNGRMAIELMDIETGEPVADATVNIPEISIEDDEIFVKEYSGNEGMTMALIASGIIEPASRGTYHVNFITVDVHRLTEKAMKELYSKEPA